jgi:hypothetical protein
MEVVLDSGAVLRVREDGGEVPDLGHTFTPVSRTWTLDGEPIPEWAGVTLVQMMVLPGRRWPHGPTG